MTKRTKTIGRMAREIATEPGIAMSLAHVLLSVATGGWGLAISCVSLTTATTLKFLTSRGTTEKIKNKRLRNLLGHENTPIRASALGLAGLAALSFGQGLGLLGFAFGCFSAGNMLFNTKPNKKFPFDNMFFTLGSCTTAFLAGGSFLPWLAIIPGSALATYNIVKPKGDRNLGHPKLWFAAAQTVSATLGLLSGQAERVFPSLAMISVTWGYSMMEARDSGWFKDKQPAVRTEERRPDKTLPDKMEPTPGPVHKKRPQQIAHPVNDRHAILLNEAFFGMASGKNPRRKSEPRQETAPAEQYPRGLNSDMKKKEP